MMVSVYRQNHGHQSEFEFFDTIEELVPEDHLLRKIDRYTNLSFIPDKVRPLLLSGEQKTCGRSGCAI